MFFSIAVAVIGFRGHRRRDLFGVPFGNVRKDILSSYSGVVSLMIKRVLVTIGFLKQSKRRNKQIRISRS